MAINLDLFRYENLIARRVMGMRWKNRNLKIVKSFTQKTKASLCLTGRWLEQAGFVVDMRVDVIVKEKCLVIVPSKAGNKQIKAEAE